MGKKIDSKDQPYVPNYPPLAKFLEQHDARCMWQLSMGGEKAYGYPTGYVELHMFPNGRSAIVVVRAKGNGWDIFTPGDSGKIVETLIDAAARLGLEVKPMGGKSVGGGRKWAHGVSFTLPSSGYRCVWRMRNGRATQLEMYVGAGSMLVGSVSSLILASQADELDKAELMAQGRAQIERQQAAARKEKP